MEHEYGLIYEIINKVNNKKYVGQTINSVNRRWTEHKRDAKFLTKYKNTPDEEKTTGMKKRMTSVDTPLHRAMNKYGVENFELIVLEDNILIEELNDKEIFYINKENSLIDFGAGYNLTIGGQQNTSVSQYTREKHRYNALNGITGWKHLGKEAVYTEEVINKMKIATAIGRQKHFESMSEEEKKRRHDKASERFKGEKNPFYGRHHSEETKQKLREINKNQPESVVQKSVSALKEYYKTHDHCFKGKTGENSSYHKKIRQFDDNGNTVNIFQTEKQALEYLGLKGHTQFQNALKNKTLFKDYYWEIIN